jgi:quinol monooxygenase YgiN
MAPRRPGSGAAFAVAIARAETCVASTPALPLDAERTVYWVFTVTVDQMNKFKPLVPKLVAATEKEPGALQFDCNVGDDQKTVHFFKRYTDSKAALFHQTESFAPFSKEFFALAKLTNTVRRRLGFIPHPRLRPARCRRLFAPAPQR